MGVRSRTSLTVQEQQQLLRDIADKGLDAALQSWEMSVENFTQLLTSGGLNSIQNEVVAQLMNSSPGELGTSQATMDAIRATANQNNFWFDRAAEAIQTGGFNPQLSQLYDRGMDVFTGQTLPQQMQLEAAGGLLANRGVTPELSVVNDRATDILNSFGQVGANELVDAQRTAGDIVSTGGYTAQSNDLLALGKSIVQAGGFTPGLVDMLGQLNSMNGGFVKTPEFTKLMGELQEIVDSGGEAGLIPIESVVDMASADIADRGMEAFKLAGSYAARTGLRPGAVTGGTGSFTEGSREILRQEGESVRDIFRNRDLVQAEQLTRALGNKTSLVQSQIAADAQANSLKASLMSSIASAASHNLGSATSLLASVEASSVARLNSALNAVSTIGGIFAAREATAFSSILQSDQQAFQHVLGGLTSLDALVNQQLGGAGVALGAAGQAGIREGTMIGAAQNATQQNLTALLGLGGLEQGNAQLDLSRLGLASDIGQQGQSNMLNTLGLMNQGQANLLNFASPMYQQMGNMGLYLAQVMSQRGIWGSALGTFLNQLAVNGANGLTGGFGNMLPGMPQTPQTFQIPGLGSSMPSTPALSNVGIQAPNIPYTSASIPGLTPAYNPLA